ncbi:CzcE family metal-binding protein [Comamonas terrigena]|uniref:CzcE family metal-binding protein n=1 Tax=Comamonas terrigena TaxID=32013 RepID=UPI0024488BF4|nr:CzcE family metal-binding protein [Comamonas terrigena]MDH1503298.1 CzcE family metal-binding protein [Comamonas terrigena]
MKAKHVILSSILFSAVAMPMLASASGSSTGGSSVSTTSSTSATKLLGRPGAASQATFVVDTTMKRPHLNIKCGETVVFTNGKDQFAWKFDVYGHRMVNLAQIAPAGFTDSEMKIYVARNDQERS